MGVAILRYAQLSNGEYLVKGKTVTGFANVEEDFADNAVWEMNLLPRDKRIMPWRIEDELKKLGANYVQAGRWRGFAIRDGTLITGAAELLWFRDGASRHRSTRGVAASRRDSETFQVWFEELCTALT